MTSGITSKMEKVVEEPTSPSPFPPFSQQTPAGLPPSQPNFTQHASKENRRRTIQVQTKDLEPLSELTALRKSITVTAQELDGCDDNGSSESSSLTPVTSNEAGRLTINPFSKSKSLSAAELSAHVMGTEEFNKVAERLKTEEPPMTLEEARQRRASIKEDRKKSIEFIRSRTNSRAAAMGRPNIDGDDIRSRANSRAAIMGRPPLGETSTSYRSDRAD